MNRKLYITVGVPSYNEEKDIEPTLNAIDKQKLPEGVAIGEIIVATDGCTDDTVAIVQRICQKNKRVHIINKKLRIGKIQAINAIISKSKFPNIIIVNVDNPPEENCFRELLAKYDRDVALVGPRSRYIHSGQGIINSANYILWSMHHEIALRSPKIGGMMLFRKSDVRAIPTRNFLDEATLEAELQKAGKRFVYAPRAVIKVKGPANIGEYLLQRRRNLVGYLLMRNNYPNYQPSTLNKKEVLTAGLKVVRREKTLLTVFSIAVLLEIYASILARKDVVLGKKYNKWPAITGSKGINDKP